MNILGLVFSLMLILSYGFYACWNKQLASNRLRTTYISHEKAHRKLLNRFESAVWDGIRNVKGGGSDPENQELQHEEESEKNPKQKPPPEPPLLNPECSRLNLWPLIQESREMHPYLYEAMAELIRTFYPSFLSEQRFEYHFLDDLLDSAKNALQSDVPFALEKITLNTYSLSYYRMLKGTKKWDLANHTGYPCLLDYVKADPQPNRICLSHAHSDVFAAFFGLKIAAPLYAEIHREGCPALTDELITTFCKREHLDPPNPQLFQLFDFNHSDDRERKKTLIAQEKGICLRKTLYIERHD